MHGRGNKVTNTDMKKFDLIDFKHLFYLVREEPYVFIKHGEIENFIPGGSVDIFCFNVDNFAKNIISYTCIHLIKDLDMEIDSHGLYTTDIHLKLNNELVFSFVLYRSFPRFENVMVEPSYMYSIIENAESRLYEYNGNKFPVFVPSQVDSLVWQYIVYLDKHEFMPNGSKHYPVIGNKLSSQRISFWDKADLYVKRRVVNYDAYSSNLVFKRTLTPSRVKRIIKKMPYPFAEVLLFVAKKTYKIFHGRN